MSMDLTSMYDHLPTNGILSAGSAFIGFIVNGVDPAITGIMMPILFFAIGKLIDVVLKIYLEKRRR